MRIPIKCFLFFLVTFNSAFGQKNFIQNLDSLCIVTFPDTPKVKSSGINTGYFISNKKERYIAMVQTFDKATINDFKDQLPSFYEGVIKGVLEESNTKGTLIYKKNIIMDGIQGIEFEYQSTINSQVPDTRFQRLVFFNDKLFNLCYWVFNDSVKDTEQSKIQFFNSFHINNKSHQ